jgi:hypothetical protein
LARTLSAAACVALPVMTEAREAWAPMPYWMRSVCPDTTRTRRDGATRLRSIRMLLAIAQRPIITAVLGAAGRLNAHYKKERARLPAMCSAAWAVPISAADQRDQALRSAPSSPR